MNRESEDQWVECEEPKRPDGLQKKGSTSWRYLMGQIILWWMLLHLIKARPLALELSCTTHCSHKSVNLKYSFLCYHKLLSYWFAISLSKLPISFWVNLSSKLWNLHRSSINTSSYSPGFWIVWRRIWVAACRHVSLPIPTTSSLYLLFPTCMHALMENNPLFPSFFPE